MGVQPSLRQIGKYTVIDVIGTGGMGIVFRAHDPTIGRTVAIKMLKHAEAGDSADLFDRFFSREMKSTGNLNHKNIVTVYDSGEQDGNAYLVMEFLEGEPASKLISERRSISLVEKLDLVIQVCDGLQYAHDRNVIHRDIKPANVILLPDGTAKIVDFGVARIVGGGSSILQTGQLVGSLSYMSPEQINSMPIDARSDIFSTGVMLYELLTYELPFKGADAGSTFVKILREDPAPLAQFVQEIPPALQTVVNHALAKNVNDRYQTAEEFSFDLLAVQRDLKTAIIADCMKRAEAAMHRGDLDRVRVHLLEVIRFDRQNERANRLLREVRKAIQQQQRASQVVQMRSQAQVALAGAQYEEALACADQALRLDPTDSASIYLCEEIRNAISRAKAVRETLNRAESALFAGDFDEAKEAVEEALRLDPSDSEARALASVVNKELAERSRRQQVQDFVEQARRGIAERKFTDALDALHRAEELDPSDSNVRELLQWAQRGQEQEKRRRSLQEITDQIEKALHEGDFSSACTISDMGLQRFPEEPTLVRLRAISEKQRDIADRRRFVQERSLAVKTLTDQGRLAEAVQSLTEALRRYPGEPNLESLLASTKTEIERQNFEREEAARQKAIQRAEAEARARLTQQVLDSSVELRRALDARADVTNVINRAAHLRSTIEAKQIDEHAKEVAALVLSEVEARIRSREQAIIELDQLRNTIEELKDTASLSEADNRLLSIKANFPNENNIQSTCAELGNAISRIREDRDRRISSLTALAQALDTTPTSGLLSVQAKAIESATGFAAEPRVGALLQQIESSVNRRLERRAELVRDLRSLLADLGGAHTREELSRTSDRASAIAATDHTDSELADLSRQVETESHRLRELMESLLREMATLGRTIGDAETVVDAEGLLPRVKELAGRRPGFQDLQEAATRIVTSVQGRRIEHDLIVQELESIRASIPLLAADEELSATVARAGQCRELHRNDPAVLAISGEIEAEVSRILQEREELRRRRQECDDAIRFAEERFRNRDFEQALEALLSQESANPERTDLRTLIADIRKAIEEARAEQERLAREREELERQERERIAREQVEAEARARKEAAEQAIRQAGELIAEGRGEDAVACLYSAIERDSENEELRSALQWTQAESDRLRAERELLELERLEKERIEQERLERERRAREQAEAAERVRRQAAALAIEQSSGLLAQGQFEESLERLRAAIERDSENEDLRRALEATTAEVARTQEEQKRREEERIAREKAELEARELQAAARLAMDHAREFLAKGQNEDAVARLRAAAEGDSGNPELRAALESTVAEVTRRRDHRERLEREQAERERVEQERLERERVAREKAEADERARQAAAEEAIDKAQELVTLRRFDEALRLIHSARERDPGSEDLRSAQEWMQEEVVRQRAEIERLERERAARELAETVARARREAVKQAIDRTWELLLQGRGDECIQVIRAALETYPESQELHSTLRSIQAEVARQRTERERLENENRERERVEKERVEQERLKREQLERERQEAATVAIRQAQELLANGREDESLNALRSALERDPETRELHLAFEEMQAKVAHQREAKERLEQERLEKEELEREQLERARVEAEKREKERVEKEKQERQRQERARLELEKLERERAAQLEKDRIEKERLEQELLERERVEAEKHEKERVEKEKLERERQERARIEQERLERERVAQLQKERVEKERLERERLELARVEAEKREKERVEKEKLERERQERARIEQERLERERLERERVEKEKQEKARLERERLEREKAERAEKERLERERLERERLERERAAKAQAEAAAQARQKSARQAIDQARNSFAAGLGEDALKTLRSALERDAENQELRSALKSTQADVARQQAERQRLEKEKLKQEKLERERAERARAADERAAAEARKNVEESKPSSNASVAPAIPASLKRQTQGTETSASHSVGVSQADAKQKSLSERAGKDIRRVAPIAIAAALILLVIGFFLFRPKHATSSDIQITFTKDPANSTLTIDDQPVDCAANCVLPLKAGTHRLALSLPGYSAKQSTIDVPDGVPANRVIALKLEPTTIATSPMASLAILTNLDLKSVSLDGRDTGDLSSHRIDLNDLAPGSHNVEVYENNQSLNLSVEISKEGMISFVGAKGLADHTVIAITKSGKEQEIFCRCNGTDLMIDGKKVKSAGRDRYKIPESGGSERHLALVRGGRSQAIDFQETDSKHSIVIIEGWSQSQSNDQKIVANPRPVEHPQTTQTYPTNTPRATSQSQTAGGSQVQPVSPVHPANTNTPEVTPADAAAWNGIKDSRNVNDYKEFRLHFPNSAFAKAAYAKGEEITWENSQASAQVSDLQQYLKDYPDGAHAAEARDRIASIQNKSQQQDREAIIRVLETYRSAYENRDLDGLASVWPNLPRTHLQATFKVASKIHVTLAPSSFTISGETVSVPCRQRIELMVGGKPVSSDDATVLFSFRKAQGKWFIDSVK